MTTKKMLSPKKVAEHLGVTVRTVYNYIDSGRLRAYRIAPRTIRIDPDDVSAMMRKCLSASDEAQA